MKNPTPEPFDIAEISTLCAQYSETAFYYDMMKSSFIAKFSKPEAEEPTAGCGQMFPDSDRTEQLDIRALLLSQPKNVASELKFHKELFSKLQSNYTEQDSKEKFLKRVLEIPAFFVDAKDVAEIQKNVDEKKLMLMDKKKLIEDKKNYLENLIDSVATAAQNNEERKKICQTLANDISALENELNVLNQRDESNQKTIVHDLKKIINDRKAKVNHVKEEIVKWKQILDEKKSGNNALESDLNSCKKKKIQCEASAAEAIRNARNKDPEFEELCKWYTEVNSLLYKINGVYKVKNISNTEFEIEYEYQEQVVATLIIKINPNADAQFKRLVNAKVKGINCPIQDIIVHANLVITKLDELMAFIVSSARVRVYEYVKLEREISELSKVYAGISYISESRHVSFTVEKTDRTFVINLKQGYPTTGQDGLEIISVEPSMPGESELWQDKLIQSKVQNLGELISMLE